MFLQWQHKLLHSPSVCSTLTQSNPEYCIAHDLRHEALPEETIKDSIQSPAIGYIIVIT